MIAICDLGLENPKRLQRMLERLGYMAIITSDHSEIACCDAVVLTGQDMFAEGFNAVKRNKLDSLILSMHKKERQIIGIGVGAHLLCRSYESDGLYKGIGLLPFDIVANTPVEGFLHTKLASRTFGADSAYLYYAQNGFLTRTEGCATAHHNGDFTAAYINKNVAALWFYPQKSGEMGLNMLKMTLDVMEGIK